MNRRFGGLFWWTSTNLSTEIVDVPAFRPVVAVWNLQGHGRRSCLAQTAARVGSVLNKLAKMCCSPYKTWEFSYK
jgi:hypothetical protein